MSESAHVKRNELLPTSLTAPIKKAVTDASKISNQRESSAYRTTPDTPLLSSLIECRFQGLGSDMPASMTSLELLFGMVVRQALKDKLMRG